MRNIIDEIRVMEKIMNTVTGNRCAALVPQKNQNGSQELSRIPEGRIYETENSVIAAFELPGAEKEEIQLDILNDRIEVKVEKKQKINTEGKEGVSCEMKQTGFYGALLLPCEVDSEKADAVFKNGMLRIEIPKLKPIDSKKRIQVK